MKVPPNTAFKKLYFLLKENPLVKIPVIPEFEKQNGGKKFELENGFFMVCA
jgi:hypothetical protein